MALLKILRFILLATALVTALFVNAPAFAADECRTCHELLGDKPSTLFKHDIHAKKGITCAGCHGGNPSAAEMDEAMNREKGFIGVPKGDSISLACANCHASKERMQQYGSTIAVDQFEKLQASVHGQLSTTGKERIAQCITCHNAHGIVSVNDRSSPVYPLNVTKTCAGCHGNASYMRSYNPGLPVDQLEKYRTSVHGLKNAKGDPKPAECASCHGSHDILSAKDVKSRVYPTNLPSTCATCHSDAQYMKGYGIPTDQFQKFAQSVHGVALLEKHDLGAPACNNCHGNHGAAPPGVESISKVCGTCHALNADLFSSSPHKRAFDERKLPECETCHSNHLIVAATNMLLGTSKEAVCSHCHSEQENVKGYHAAGVMRALVDSLDKEENKARGLVEEAEQKGMEVGEAKFKLRDVRQARLEARTEVHAFDPEKVRTVVEKGLNVAALVSSSGQEAIDEYYFRRIGLGISTLIITMLAISLYLFIRRIERRQQSKSHN